jgi:hypothetical protein
MKAMLQITLVGSSLYFFVDLQFPIFVIYLELLLIDLNFSPATVAANVIGA